MTLGITVTAFKISQLVDCINNKRLACNALIESHGASMTHGSHNQ